MDQFHSIGSLVEMGNQVDSPLNHLRRDGLYSMRRTIAEFRVQLGIAERAFRRARGAGRFQCSSSSIRPPHRNLGPALWVLSRLAPWMRAAKARTRGSSTAATSP